MLTRLVENNRLADDEQQRLIECVNEQLATALLRQEWVTADTRRKVATAVGGMPLLRELALGSLSQFTDEEATRLLDSFEQWAPESAFKERSLLLQVLLLRRPSLVAAAAKSHSDALVTAAAGVLGLAEDLARHIGGLDTETDDSILVGRKFALLALVNNPSVDLEVAEAVGQRVAKLPELEQVAAALPRRRQRPRKVDDPCTAQGDELAWLVHRSLPSDYGPGRLPDMVRLLANHHLVEQDRTAIRGGILQWIRFDEPLREALAGLLAVDPDFDLDDRVDAHQRVDDIPMFVNEFCKAAEQALGSEQEKWDNLIGLMHEFDGTAEDLLVTCAYL